MESPDYLRSIPAQLFLSFTLLADAEKLLLAVRNLELMSARSVAISRAIQSANGADDIDGAIPKLLESFHDLHRRLEEQKSQFIKCLTDEARSLGLEKQQLGLEPDRPLHGFDQFCMSLRLRATLCKLWVSPRINELAVMQQGYQMYNYNGSAIGQKWLMLNEIKPLNSPGESVLDGKLMTSAQAAGDFLKKICLKHENGTLQVEDFAGLSFSATFSDVFFYLNRLERIAKSSAQTCS